MNIENGGGSSFAWDGDALIYFNNTGLSDNGLKIILNELVLDLKYYNLWNTMQAIYPFIGGTAALHKWNLKNPQDTDAAYRLGFSGGGWTHSSTGALPNGTSSYANTFYNPFSAATISGFSFGIYSRTNDLTGTQVYGCTSDGGTTNSQHNITANMYNAGVIGGTGNFSFTPTRSDRMLINRRGSTTDMQGYRDGVSLGTNTGVPTVNQPNTNFFFAARSNSLTPIFYCKQQLAFAFLGLAMTNQQALDLTLIVNKYQSSLGRNV